MIKAALNKREETIEQKRKTQSKFKGEKKGINI